MQRCKDICGGRWKLLAAAVCAALASIVPDRADADEFSKNVWMGASATDDSWLIYSGGTLAPFGHIHDDGVRVRAWGGYGQYRYSGNERGNDLPFIGTVTLLDALLGYHHQFGPLTAKAFIGLTMIQHDIAPREAAATSAGTEIGPKLQTELWYDAGGKYWASLNASFTTAHDTYAARARLGWRLSDRIAVGPELAIDDNAVDHVDLDSAFVRGGTFVTYSWGTGEISASGGLAGDIDGAESPYITVNLYTNF